MSKYKSGDKIVFTVTGMHVLDEAYILNNNFILSEQSVGEYAEPLSTYTEPLEAKIRRQAAEITRLLAENKELKEDFEKSKRVNLNMGRCAGQKEAWELARKIVDDIPNGGYSAGELKKIFGCAIPEPCIVENTYPEAAAKVAEWEKTKEIKIGDVLEDIADNNVKCIVTNLYPNNMVYLVFYDGTAGMHKLDNFKKTGRHIDINSFLKQIGGEQE